MKKRPRDSDPAAVDFEKRRRHAGLGALSRFPALRLAEGSFAVPETVRMGTGLLPVADADAPVVEESGARTIDKLTYVLCTERLPGSAGGDRRLGAGILQFRRKQTLAACLDRLQSLVPPGNDAARRLVRSQAFLRVLATQRLRQLLQPPDPHPAPSGPLESDDDADTPLVDPQRAAAAGGPQTRPLRLSPGKAYPWLGEVEALTGASFEVAAAAPDVSRDIFFPAAPGTAAQATLVQFSCAEAPAAEEKPGQNAGGAGIGEGEPDAPASVVVPLGFVSVAGRSGDTPPAARSSPIVAKAPRNSVPQPALRAKLRPHAKCIVHHPNDTLCHDMMLPTLTIGRDPTTPLTLDISTPSAVPKRISRKHALLAAHPSGIIILPLGLNSFDISVGGEETQTLSTSSHPLIVRQRAVITVVDVTIVLIPGC
ncbi:hypothetical protein DIPPA_31157 [Diplonema papillatum]|nr:hypothetical protein DIPPA_31157 [Diplonema papillatum]